MLVFLLVHAVILDSRDPSMPQSYCKSETTQTFYRASPQHLRLFAAARAPATNKTLGLSFSLCLKFLTQPHWCETVTSADSE